MTRKLVSHLFTSVDGIASDPYVFQFDAFDADLARHMTEGIASIDEVVMGRVTYEEWSGHWPAVTDGPDLPFAEFINGAPKHVASRTLTPEQITWSGARLIPGDLLDAIRELKQRPGGDIAVQGSLTVVRQCLEAGLLDELHLIIHPAVAGTGRSLYEGMGLTRLTLLGARTTEKGNVIATYGPRAD